MPGPDHAVADDSIEPYYVAKVTRDDPRPVEVNSADRTMPPLPCTFESITPALVTGVLGYIIGAGRRSISMIFSKQARGFAGLHKEGFGSAKNFAVLSFSYSLPLCILKRVRDTDDWKNHTAAGVLSGFVISWGNGPINMLGSSLLLGAISGYLSRSDPTVAHAATAQPQPETSHLALSGNVRSGQSRGSRNSAAGSKSFDNTEPSACEDLLRYAATWAHTYSQDRHSTQPWRSGWQGHGLHAAEAVWSAIRPGCRSCTIQPHAEQKAQHPVPALLRGGRQEPRGLRASQNGTLSAASSSAHDPWEPAQVASVTALTRCTK